MQEKNNTNQDMLDYLQRRWVYAEIKFSLIQIAHDLLADEIYSREEAVQAMLKLIQLVEKEELELSQAWG